MNIFETTFGKEFCENVEDEVRSQTRTSKESRDILEALLEQNQMLVKQNQSLIDGIVKGFMELSNKLDSVIDVNKSIEQNTKETSRDTKELRIIKEGEAKTLNYSHYYDELMSFRQSYECDNINHNIAGTIENEDFNKNLESLEENSRF